MGAVPPCPIWPVQQQVSPSLPACTGTGRWLVSGVRELVLFSGSFALFCHQGEYYQQKAQAASLAAARRRRRRKVGAGDPYPHCPLEIIMNYLAAELAPGQEERLCCPSPRSCSCCLRHHNLGSCQTGLQEQFPHFAPCWWLCAFLAARQPPPRRCKPSSPSPPCCCSACFFLASSASPRSCPAQAGSGSPSLCQSQHGSSDALSPVPVLSVPHRPSPIDR